MSTGLRFRSLSLGLLLVLLIAGLTNGCSVGNVEVKDGATKRGNIELTVGNVEVGSDCTIEGQISVTAGNVEIGSRSQVSGDISVDQGNVVLGREVSTDSIKLDNGTLEIGEGARINGSVTLNNGLIELRGAQVTGPVRLKRGRLEVGSGSHLAAGLEVITPDGALNDTTYVVIASGARIEGTIRTQGLVRLRVAAAALVDQAEFVGNAPEFLE